MKIFLRTLKWEAKKILPMPVVTVVLVLVVLRGLLFSIQRGYIFGEGVNRVFWTACALISVFCMSVYPSWKMVDFRRKTGLPEHMVGRSYRVIFLAKTICNFFVVALGMAAAAYAIYVSVIMNNRSFDDGPDNYFYLLVVFIVCSISFPLLCVWIVTPSHFKGKKIPKWVKATTYMTWLLLVFSSIWVILALVDFTGINAILERIPRFFNFLLFLPLLYSACAVWRYDNELDAGGKVADVIF